MMQHKSPATSARPKAANVPGNATPLGAHRPSVPPASVPRPTPRAERLAKMQPAKAPPSRTPSARPMSALPPLAQPVKTQPVKTQPVSVLPMKAEPVKTQPVSAPTAKVSLPPPLPATRLSPPPAPQRKPTSVAPVAPIAVAPPVAPRPPLVTDSMLLDDSDLLEADDELPPSGAVRVKQSTMRDALPELHGFSRTEPPPSATASRRAGVATAFIGLLLAAAAGVFLLSHPFPQHVGQLLEVKVQRPVLASALLSTSALALSAPTVHEPGVQPSNALAAANKGAHGKPVARGKHPATAPAKSKSAPKPHPRQHALVETPEAM